MSVRVMAKVWESSRQSGSALLTLLAIADNANDEGVAFPTQERIAEKVRMSVRQVRTIIHVLEESGELLVTKERSGRFFRNRYRIVLSTGKDFRMNEDSTGKDFLLTGESTGNIGSIQPEVATADKPSVEPSVASKQTLARPRKPRPRDHVWDALVKEFGEPTTRSERSRMNDATKQLRDAGVDPSMISVVASRYRSEWPTVTCTAHAIVANWSRFANGNSNGRKPHACHCGVSFLTASRLSEHQSDVHGQGRILS